MPYTQFNLPRYHLTEGSPHFVPFKARYEGEIGRRKDMRHGSLIYEQQADGARIANHMLSRMERYDIDDGGFTANILASASINSSWYMFTRDAKVMDRRLHLPVLVSETENGDIEAETRKDLIGKCAQGMFYASRFAERYSRAYEASKDSKRGRVELGRMFGDTSLSLASLDVITTVSVDGPFEAQDLVRERCMNMLEQAKGLACEIHSYPSMAQLADEKSDLRLYWKRRAPNEALELLETGLEGFTR